MTTTVQVSDETKRLLDIKKQATKKSYDKIIKEMLTKDQPESLAGAFPKLQPWTKQDRGTSRYD